MSDSHQAQAPAVGTTLAGRYKLEALLGQGGMCAVYRAEDSRTPRRVAIKVLPAERAAVPEMAARFQREVTTGKRIEHPNVAAMFDSGVLADGALYLVMELCEGRSLERVLTGGRLAVPRAVAIARQLLAGLAVAHRLGVTHRDVKPDNIILVDEAGVETVKLLDFGIASNERSAMKLTTAGVAFGTPEYISPEMAMGLAVDARADLYAVGVVLFEMLTGRLPFTQSDPRALLLAHVETVPPLAGAVAGQPIPAALEQGIARALAKLPEARFPSAEAMIEALDAVPLQVEPRHSRRRRRLAAGVGVALAATALLGVAWWWSRSQPQPQPRPRSTSAPHPPPAAAPKTAPPAKSTQKKAPHRVR